jgi:hypothetical protein
VEGKKNMPTMRMSLTFARSAMKVRAANPTIPTATGAENLGVENPIAPAPPISEVVRKLTPTEGDYVYADFRALSAVDIPDRYITFSKPGVVQASAAKLANQTVYSDHRVSVHNWAGVVQSSNYNPLGVNNEVNQPGGIDVSLKIDAVKEPNIARALLSDPSPIHSVSVGVSFDWEKSHPSMEDRDFWYKLGEVVDGKLVQRVATEITGFHEISLVYQGADPTAKRANRASQSKDQPTNLTNSLEGGDTMLKEQLAKMLGLDPESGDEVLMNAFSTKLTQSAPQVTEKAPEWLKLDQLALEALVTEHSALKAQSAELATKAELGDKYLSNQRQEALRLFNLVEGKPDEAITAMLSAANLDTSKAYIDLYTKKADEKFKPHCAKCGGTELSRQSSKQTDPESLTTNPSGTQNDVVLPIVNVH